MTNEKAKHIVLAVAQNVGVTVAKLTGRKRNRSLATARGIAAYLLRQRLKLSLQEIGRMLGGRDHSTVISAIRAIEHRLARGDPFLGARIRALKDVTDASPAPVAEPALDISLNAEPGQRVVEADGLRLGPCKRVRVYLAHASGFALEWDSAS